MTQMIFSSAAHEEFYQDMLMRCGNRDSYHQAFFYCMGIAAETRENIHSLFDLENDRVRFKGLKEGWQTGGSIRLCRLALNLWNGHLGKGEERLYTPYALFDCSFAPYFMQAVQLRYGEYFREDRAFIKTGECLER